MADAPDPVVVRGYAMRHEDHPGVSFVVPWNPDSMGGGQTANGWNIPLVLVEKDLTVEQVLAAAVHVGHLHGLTGLLRKAVNAWAKSEDYRQNPHRVPSEWNQQAV